MSSPDVLGILNRQPEHLFVRSFGPDQAGSGGLAEGQSEHYPGYGGDQYLIQILHRLDEMRLAQDEVDIFRLFDSYCFYLHKGSFPKNKARSFCRA